MVSRQFGNRGPMVAAGVGRVPVRKEKAKIVVAICSCGSNRERREAVRRTWLSRPASGVRHFFFVGRGADTAGENDVVVLDVDDGYEFLPLKVREAFAYALRNFDSEWIFNGGSMTTTTSPSPWATGCGTTTATAPTEAWASRPPTSSPASPSTAELTC